MTIQEAIKSGKPFRRKSNFVFLRVEDDMIVFPDYKKPESMDNNWYFPFLSDILADDWEVKDSHNTEKP